MAGLGFISVSTGLFYWLLGEKWMETLQGITPGMNQQQTEMQAMWDEIAALQQRWAPVAIAQMILHPVLIVLLLVAAMRGLQMRAGAGKLLATTMVFAILFELARFYPNLMMQQASQEISLRYQNKMAGGRPAALPIMKLIQQITAAATYLIIGGWLSVKLCYYGIALWYVSRKDVRALFEPEAESEDRRGRAGE